MEMYTKIIEAFAGKKYDGVSSASEILKGIVGSPTKCCDCYIEERKQDGEYVVKASFYFSNSPITVHIYYGYDTSTVFSVKFNEGNDTKSVKDRTNKLIDDFTDVICKVINFAYDDRSIGKEGIENLTIAEIKNIVSKIEDR